MSDGDEAVDWVVSKVGLWWPDAEEGDIRKAADAWDRVASALERAGDGARGGANQALAHWRGAAAASFERQWAEYSGAVAPTAQGARSLAGGLRDYATEVENAKQEVYVLAAEIGASIAIGAAMAFFTFGTSAVAAGGAVAGIRAAALAIAERLTVAVGEIATRAIIGAAFGSVSSMAANLAVAQPLRVEVFDNGGYSLAETSEAGLAGGATGGLLGGAGGLASRLRPAAAARQIPGLDTARPSAGNPSTYPPTANRVKLRAQTRRDIFAAGERNPDGSFVGALSGDRIPARLDVHGDPVRIDPATGKADPSGMTVPEDGAFHFSHNENQEWWRYKREAEYHQYDRPRVIADQNDPARYHLDTPEFNRGHQGENPDPFVPPNAPGAPAPSPLTVGLGAGAGSAATGGDHAGG